MTNETKNIVLSGASSGIGYYTALKLCEQGHNVYAIARREDKLKSLKEESQSYKGKIEIIPSDLSKFDKNQFDTFFKEINRIDVLINNAGVLLNKKFLEIEEEEIQKVFNLNYISVIKLIQYFHSRLSKSTKPHIVNIGSVGGITGSVKFPGLSIYSSSKGALSILSECLANDFKDDGIKVNCLALGSVNTDMLREAFPEFISQTSPEDMARYITSFSLTAQDVMNGVTQVVSVSNP